MTEHLSVVPFEALSLPLDASGSAGAPGMGSGVRGVYGIDPFPHVRQEQWGETRRRIAALRRLPPSPTSRLIGVRGQASDGDGRRRT